MTTVHQSMRQPTTRVHSPSNVLYMLYHSVKAVDHVAARRIKYEKAHIWYNRLRKHGLTYWTDCYGATPKLVELFSYYG
jgi:hypothetical protein